MFFEPNETQRLVQQAARSYASEIEAEAVSTADGPVPVANVLAFDAPRTPQT